MSKINLKYAQISRGNKIARFLWRLVWLVFFRPSPRFLFGWRRFLLRLFGARVGVGAIVYPTVNIWAPWNLFLGNHSCLSHHVECYCVDIIDVGDFVTVSQFSHLCTASHDYNKKGLPLVVAPIKLCDYSWITADVFVGPGVTVGIGAVAVARSTVVRDIKPWEVVGGNPAKFIGVRNSIAFIQ